MNIKYLYPVSLIVVFLILGAVYLNQKDVRNPESQEEASGEQVVEVAPSSVSPSTSPIVVPKPSTTPTPTPVAPAPNPSSFTMAQVRTHKSKASCYTTINGNVYDVTSWISKHPGGASAILSLCGTDGTAAFEGEHGGERRPETELASFKIGTLRGN